MAIEIRLRSQTRILCKLMLLIIGEMDLNLKIALKCNEVLIAIKCIARLIQQLFGSLNYEKIFFPFLYCIKVLTLFSNERNSIQFWRESNFEKLWLQWRPVGTRPTSCQPYSRYTTSSQTIRSFSAWFQWNSVQSKIKLSLKGQYWSAECPMYEQCWRRWLSGTGGNPAMPYGWMVDWSPWRTRSDHSSVPMHSTSS